MNRILAVLTCVTALGAMTTFLPASSMAAEVEAAAPDAGEYDFGDFPVPDGDGEFVEVNLTRDLIAIASRLVSKEEPDVAAVLAGLRKVRVHVIGIDDSNRAALVERVTRARKDLGGRAWQKVVTVRESGQEVDIYVKTKGEDMIDGLVVTVIEGGEQAVFINIVGNIKPEQIAMLGERFGLEPLRHVGQHTAPDAGG